MNSIKLNMNDVLVQLITTSDVHQYVHYCVQHNVDGYQIAIQYNSNDAVSGLIDADMWLSDVWVGEIIRRGWLNIVHKLHDKRMIALSGQNIGWCIPICTSR